MGKANPSPPASTVSRGKVVSSTAVMTPSHASETPAKAWKNLMVDDESSDKASPPYPAVTVTNSVASSSSPATTVTKDKANPSLPAATVAKGTAVPSGAGTTPSRAKQTPSEVRKQPTIDDENPDKCP